MKKMDIHRWKDNKLNEMLMEKFGYKKKKDPELLKEGTDPDDRPAGGEGSLSQKEKDCKGTWMKPGDAGFDAYRGKHGYCKEQANEGFGEGKPAEGKWSEKKVYSEAAEPPTREDCKALIGAGGGYKPENPRELAMAQACDKLYTLKQLRAPEDLEERRRTKVSEAAEAVEGSVGGVPHVPPGDYEGMAHAAIAAIVQLASEAGIEIDITTGPEAEPEDESPWDTEPLETADLGPEAGEEELLSPEDL